MMIAAALLAGIGYILFSQVQSYATFLIVYLGVISVAFTRGIRPCADCRREQLVHSPSCAGDDRR